MSSSEPDDARRGRTRIAGLDADVLALAKLAPQLDDWIVAINRSGSAYASVGGGGAPWHAIWQDGLSAADPHAVVRQPELVAGLPAPAKTPAAAPRTLTYRFIARALLLAMENRAPWDCRSGVDEDPYWAGVTVREKLLSAFPAAAPRLEHREANDLAGLSACRFWVLLRNGDPVLLAEDSTATVWRADRSYDLMSLYPVHRRRVLPLIVQIVDHLLE